MIDKSDEGLSEAAKNFLIATDYETGSHGKPKDLTRAATYMIQAAELGHCLAAYDVAAMYFHGRGVPRDLELARQWALRLNALGSSEYAERLLTAIDQKESGTSNTDETPPKEPERRTSAIKRNLFEFAKSVGQTILGICLLASVGYCSGGGHFEKDDGLGEVPDQYRKP